MTSKPRAVSVTYLQEMFERVKKLKKACPRDQDLDHASDHSMITRYEALLSLNDHEILDLSKMSRGFVPGRRHTERPLYAEHDYDVVPWVGVAALNHALKALRRAYAPVAGRQQAKPMYGRDSGFVQAVVIVEAPSAEAA